MKLATLNAQRQQSQQTQLLSARSGRWCCGFSFGVQGGVESLIKCCVGRVGVGSTKIYKMQARASWGESCCPKSVLYCCCCCRSFCNHLFFELLSLRWLPPLAPINMSHLGATTCQELVACAPSNKPMRSLFSPLISHHFPLSAN